MQIASSVLERREHFRANRPSFALRKAASIMDASMRMVCSIMILRALKPIWLLLALSMAACMRLCRCCRRTSYDTSGSSTPGGGAGSARYRIRAVSLRRSHSRFTHARRQSSFDSSDHAATAPETNSPKVT